MNPRFERTQEAQTSRFFFLFAFQAVTAVLLILELFKLMKPGEFSWTIDFPALTDLQNLQLLCGTALVILFSGGPGFCARLFLLWIPLFFLLVHILNFATQTGFSLLFVAQAGLLIFLILHIEDALAKLSRTVGATFVLANSVFLGFAYLDGHFFSIAKTHIGIMQIWQLRFAGMTDIAGLTVDTTAHVWSKMAAYAIVTLLLLVRFHRPVPRPFNSRFPVIAAVACLFLVRLHFDVIAEIRPIEDYLMLRTEAGGIPLPLPPRLRSPEVLEAIASAAVPGWNGPFPVASYSWVPGARRMNLVMLLVESWRADFFRMLMSRTKKLAENGIVLRNHFSQSNLSVTAIFSLYHGFFPLDFRARYPETPPPAFPRFLKDSGYGLKRIVSDWDGSVDPIFREFEMRILKADTKYSGTAAVLRDVLGELRKPGPHLIDATLFHTHFNYYFPPELEIFKPVFPENRNLFLFFEPTPEIISQLRNRYKNAVLFLDLMIESFFARVREEGLDKETVFVLVGDHGESIGECGFMAHGTGPHESQFRVPCLILAPGASPRIVEGMTQHVDILPTLAPMMGFTATGTTGRDALTSSRTFILNRDDSVENRLVLRREDSISLFDADGSGNARWVVTTTPQFTLDGEIRSLYSPGNHLRLAARINEDSAALREFFK